MSLGSVFLDDIAWVAGLQGQCGVANDVVQRIRRELACSDGTVAPDCAKAHAAAEAAETALIKLHRALCEGQAENLKRGDAC